MYNKKLNSQNTPSSLKAKHADYIKTASRLEEGLFLKTEAALTDGEFEAAKDVVFSTSFVREYDPSYPEAAVKDMQACLTDGSGDFEYNCPDEDGNYHRVIATIKDGECVDIASIDANEDGSEFTDFNDNPDLKDQLSYVAQYVMLIEDSEFQPTGKFKEMIDTFDTNYREENGQENLFYDEYGSSDFEKKHQEKTSAADRNPVITTTYAVVTPESAENGDFEETGFKDEEGESMLVDEFDDEDATVVSKAVKFLNKKGANYPSNSSFNVGTWYSDGGDTDFRTGAETTYSYHLSGFTPEEEKAIYDQVAH